MTVTLEDVRAAAAAIDGNVVRTPCLLSRTLSEITGAQIYLKFENHQFTASFKERGALNKLLSLAPERPAPRPDTQPFTPPPPPPAPRPVPLSLAPQGYYIIGAASLIWPLGHPRAFPRPEANSGGAGSIRVGYRVNTPAAFDVMLQYANISIGSDDPAYPDARYTIGSTRLGLNVRLMTPGQTWRFAGSIGGGGRLSRRPDRPGADPTPAPGAGGRAGAGSRRAARS